MRTYKDLLHVLQKAVAHKRVYFQPPENLKIEYPAVIFHLSNLTAQTMHLTRVLESTRLRSSLKSQSLRFLTRFSRSHTRLWTQHTSQTE